MLATYQYGGTFIGAVICSDGIVVAADSRTTFTDGRGNAFAFLDGTPKIFVDRGAAVAISGMTSLEGELFSSFVNRNRFLLARSVNEILFGFLLYVPFENSNGVVLISAGFLDGKPMICAKAPITPQNCSGSGFFSNKVSPILRSSLARLSRPPTTAEGVEMLKAAIGESARTDSSVGGPISILKLTNDGLPEWSGAVLSDGGLSQICELIRLRRPDIMPFGSRQDLDLRLSAACPK
jgi:20S proteasome alpha/beta subunit